MGGAALLRPKALRPGDVVAVAALSGGLEQSEEPLFVRGVEVLKRMGFVVRPSPLVDLNLRWWWGPAPPRETADELNALLRDPEVRAIFALTGGRMTLTYLDLIDLAAVVSDPKPLLGMSDISALLLALHARTRLVSFHADIVTYGFGEWDDCDQGRREALSDIYHRVLTSNTAPGALPRSDRWECWQSGRAQGPIIGGMLNRLVRIQATPFALNPEILEGAILFWEEAWTSTAGIWNDLHVLRSAGVLDQIAGMVVGAPFELESTEGGPDTLQEIVLEVLGERDIPVLGNVDVGHSGPNLPMPLGILAGVDADALELALLEPAVE
jgi:muramoyltetrapeptide carboxypeptidase